MKYIIYSLFILLASSCIKDYNSSTSTYFKNDTSHKIEVIPYSNGAINNGDYKIVLPNQDVKVFSKSVRGKTLSPDFATLLLFNDSVMVRFDDTVHITHLKSNTEIQSGHYIFFDNNRSVLNTANYVKTIERETKHVLEGNYRYTFSEQDYNDAQ